MSSNDQPSPIICRICNVNKAKTTCYSCNTCVCLTCYRIAFVKFSHYTGRDPDDEYIKLKRCTLCDCDNHFPKIIDQSDSP